jgi:hypothetical protein
MEYTTMVLPSSLLEEEVELLSVGILNDQPPLGLPGPSYIVVARVTTVTLDQELPTTLQIGQADEGKDP